MRRADRGGRGGRRRHDQDAEVLRTGRAAAAGRAHAHGVPAQGPEVVKRRHFIRRGQAAGLTLAQIRTILEVRDAGHAPSAHVERLLADRLDAIDRQIAALHQLCATVAGLHSAASEVEPDSCAPEAICRYL